MSGVALLLLALVWAGPAAAQWKPGTPGDSGSSTPPPAKWWNSEQYRRELSLTQEQSRRLEEIFQAALPGLRTHKQALDTAEKEFERLVERADDGAVMNQVDKVEMARAALNKSRTLMLLRMRKVLTSDQWVKLGALRQAADQQSSARAGGAR
jgi:Spy/CpxP family protein refolding chaperone